MSALGGLIAGFFTCATAMAPLAIYLARGWRNEAREHRRALDERDVANDAVRIVQGRADAAERGLKYNSDRIVALGRQIEADRRFTDIGRKEAARRHAQDATRKAERAARRAAK